MTPVLTVASGICLLGGAFFCVTAVVGILRFPDLYTRLHAATKGVTAGAILLLLGVALLEGFGPVLAKLALIGVFLVVTNPMATHAIARAACREGICRPQVVVDEYGDFLAELREMTSDGRYPVDRW